MKSVANIKNTNLIHALLSGVAGTTAMTAFSYLVSQKQGRYFKEPEILNDLLYALLKVNRNDREPLPGFIAHYATGTFFATCYHLLAKKKNGPSFVGNGLLFGLAFGLVGIGIWKAVFTLHPKPPSIHLRDYLAHLIVAHLIFGETVAATTAMLPKDEASRTIQPAGVESKRKLPPAPAEVRSGDARLY